MSVKHVMSFGKSIMCARRIEQKSEHANRFSMYGDWVIWCYCIAVAVFWPSRGVCLSTDTITITIILHFSTSIRKLAFDVFSPPLCLTHRKHTKIYLPTTSVYHKVELHSNITCAIHESNLVPVTRICIMTMRKCYQMTICLTR